MKHQNSNTQNEPNNVSNYTLSHSKFVTGVFIVCAYASLGLAHLIQLDGHGVISYLYISPVTLFCVWMAILSVKWKVKVRGDRITVYYPFFKPYSFTFQEITRVKHGLYLVVYKKRKRVLSVDKIATGYHYLFKQLCELDKMDGYQDKDNFSSKPIIAVVILSFAMSLGFAWISIGLAFEVGTISFTVALLAIIAITLLYLGFLVLRYRIKVKGDRVYVRRAFSEKRYSFSKIKKAEIDFDSLRVKRLSVYTKNKRLVRILKSDVGYITWLKKLDSEGVKVVYKGD